MNLARIKKIIFFLKVRGIRYLYNRVWINLVNSNSNFLCKIFKISPFLIPRLSMVEIEPTTFCNFRCIMCEHSYWNEKPKHLSFKNFKKMVDKFNLKYIGMTGIGEGFLNKDYIKMFKYVRNKFPSCFIEIYDPFLFLNKKMGRSLIELKIDKIWVSMEGATKKTYEKIRRGSNFNMVMKNIKDFIEIKKETGEYFPEITFHYIIMKDNKHEIKKYIKLISELGIKNPNISFSTLLTFKQIKNISVDIDEDYIKEAKTLAKKLGVYTTWSKTTVINKPPINKCIAWMVPFVLVDGSILPCCALNEGNQREFQKSNAIGNLIEEDLDEIWKRKYKPLALKILEGNVPKVCKNCRVFKTN